MRGATRGTSVEPETVEAAPVSRPLSLADFRDLPDEDHYRPTDLANGFGGSVRSWQRACERAKIRAVALLGGGWTIPRTEVLAYIARSRASQMTGHSRVARAKRCSPQPNCRADAIYFILDAEAGIIKIGFTSRGADIDQRLREIQREHPRKLVLIAAADGSMRDEHRLHKELHEFRMGGEWFRDCAQVRSCIRAVLASGGAAKP